MDLTTHYMGIPLKNPLVVAASPVSEYLDNFRKLEDAGVAAIVNRSLFEEQITNEVYESEYYSKQGRDSFSEALTFFPEPIDFYLSPDEYCNHIQRAKKVVSIPIIGSLNGYSMGGWTDYAKRIESAGADALELNIYSVQTDLSVPGEDIEKMYADIIQRVKSSIKIPVAVKLSPYFTSMAHMARRLDETGADGLVLFNRFYQPDFDLETLEIKPKLLMSGPFEMRLPLRWIAILYGRVKASLAASTGVYTALDVLKLMMAGADVTMLCSAVLKYGIRHISKILEEVEQWMKEHEYKSVEQLKGSMSQKSCGNPKAFERANYMRVLQSFKGVVF